MAQEGVVTIPKNSSDRFGKAVEDAAEETFLLFSECSPASNLGFIDAKSATIEVDVGARTLHLKQSPGLLMSDRSTGTTGAVLWTITPLVAAWLASMPKYLTSKGILSSNTTIIELGCGITGLIGLVMAPLVKSYILTDQSYVRKILRENIESNAVVGVVKQSKMHVSAGGQQIPQFMPLDWETDDVAGLLHSLSDHEHLDLVVVCDCIYNEHLIGPLVETLQDLCRLGTSDDKVTYVFIAQQLRSDEIMERFLESMLKVFSIWRIPDDHLSAGLKSGGGYAVHLACLRGKITPAE